jgi:transketolase
METMRDRFHATTAQLLDDDPRMALVLADIGTSAFVRSLRRHPQRAVNVGIREQLMIGVASGLALTGYRPIAYSYTPFLVERPFEMIKLDLGHNDLGAILVSIGASYDAAAEGRTHQAPEDVALMATLPGWEIHVPGHPDETEALLRHAAVGEGRVYLRLDDRSNTTARSAEPGRLEVIRRGSAATVLTVGPMLDRTLQAVEGMDVTVLYATTLRPFDGDTLVAELNAPELILVEPYLEGTTLGLIAEMLRGVAVRWLSLGVQRVEHRRYGTPADHDLAHRLDPASLRARIEAFLEGGVAPKR